MNTVATIVLLDPRNFKRRCYLQQEEVSEFVKLVADMTPCFEDILVLLLIVFFALIRFLGFGSILRCGK